MPNRHVYAGKMLGRQITTILSGVSNSRGKEEANSWGVGKQALQVGHLKNEHTRRRTTRV